MSKYTVFFTSNQNKKLVESLDRLSKNGSNNSPPVFVKKENVTLSCDSGCDTSIPSTINQSIELFDITKFHKKNELYIMKDTNTSLVESIENKTKAEADKIFKKVYNLHTIDTNSLGNNNDVYIESITPIQQAIDVFKGGSKDSVPRYNLYITTPSNSMLLKSLKQHSTSDTPIFNMVSTNKLNCTDIDDHSSDCSLEQQQQNPSTVELFDLQKFSENKHFYVTKKENKSLVDSIDKLSKPESNIFKKIDNIREYQSDNISTLKTDDSLTIFPMVALKELLDVFNPYL